MPKFLDPVTLSMGYSDDPQIALYAPLNFLPKANVVALPCITRDSVQDWGSGDEPTPQLWINFPDILFYRITAASSATNTWSIYLSAPLFDFNHQALTDLNLFKTLVADGKTLGACGTVTENPNTSRQVTYPALDVNFNISMNTIVVGYLKDGERQLYNPSTSWNAIISQRIRPYDYTT